MTRQQLARDLADVLNRHSVDNIMNTPDYVLAERMVNMLRGSRRTWWSPHQMFTAALNRMDDIMATVQEFADKVETYIGDVNTKLAALRASVESLTEQLQAGGVPADVQTRIDQVNADLDTAEKTLQDPPVAQPPVVEPAPAPVVPVQTDPASAVVPADGTTPAPAADPTPAVDPNSATPTRTDPAASLSDTPAGAQG